MCIKTRVSGLKGNHVISILEINQYNAKNVGNKKILTLKY